MQSFVILILFIYVSILLAISIINNIHYTADFYTGVFRNHRLKHTGKEQACQYNFPFHTVRVRKKCQTLLPFTVNYHLPSLRPCLYNIYPVWQGDAFRSACCPLNAGAPGKGIDGYGHFPCGRFDDKEVVAAVYLYCAMGEGGGGGGDAYRYQFVFRDVCQGNSIPAAAQIGCFRAYVVDKNHRLYPAVGFLQCKVKVNAVAG
ncbi:hypothetical protein Barb7_01842 [Bacteroidales bacterium Barb7]|nr:hypothetical protein Barb7_01842 [Bacteroidales bacterium Barb7]